MKSATIAVAVLASVAMAQPHGHARRHHHDKRELVVEWVTEIETVTVVEDEATTQTFYPAKTAEAVAATTSGSPGEFFQASSSSSYSAAAPSTTLIVKPSTEKSTAAASTSTSTTPVVVVEPTPTTPTVVEPTTSITSVVEPTTTQAATTPVAETSTYVPAPASTTTAASSGSSGAKVKDSDMTYYQIGMGACGYDDSGLDLTKPVVAVDSKLWQSVSTATSYGVDQPAHPFCNQEITITYGDKTTTGIIRDECGGCTADAIDVAEGLFDDLVGGTGAGRVKVSWYFNSGEW